MSDEPVVPRVILHAFSTFKLGGPQARFVQLANAFGGRYRHVIAAMDNCFDAGERLGPEVRWERLDLPVVKGSALANRGAFRQVLGRLQPDLLITYNWGAIEWAAANLPRRVPQVHVEDGFGPEEAARPLPRRSRMRRVLLGWARVPVVVASRNLERIATEVWRLPARRVRFVPNGVDLPATVPPRDGAAPRIGTVAGLRPEKNIARLIRAFAQVGAPHGASLTVVGDGPLRGELEALARELGVAERVEFAGYQADPAPLLRRLDLFALSSDTEQLPMALLEAMAVGLPVLATRVGDVPDILAEVAPGNVCDADDAAFTEALRRVLAARGQWREWGASGRRVVAAAYTRENMLGRWQAVFDGRPVHVW